MDREYHYIESHKLIEALDKQHAADLALKRELVEALKEEHEHFLDFAYRDKKVHKCDYCRLCALITRAEATL